MVSKAKLVNFMWFDKGEASKAAAFYALVFPDSKVGKAHKSPADYPGGKEGDDLMVEFTVLGQPFVGLNGGTAGFKPNESVSFQVLTDTQEETDRYWNAITKNGEESACGWCKDRWGYSWQITPRVLMEAYENPDKTVAKRAMEAMMKMRKIDIAAIKAAIAGQQTT